MTLTGRSEIALEGFKPQRTLKETLKKRAEQQLKNKGIDWNKRKDIWLESVKELYDEIEQWFPDYVKEGFMTFGRSKEKTISEKDIETYNLNVFEIDVEGDIVIFDPIGTNVLGAFGRIDVYLRGHKADQVMLLLNYNEENYEESKQWKLLVEKYQFDFTKARFEELLLMWFEGWSNEI